MMEGATKSGTNQVHGSAFEYLRNDFFNAADPFTGIDAPIRWNQFGGSLGAPIMKNKLFAFFAYQGTRRNLSGALITTVPTAAERNGDLTSLLGDYICADGSTSATGVRLQRMSGPLKEPRFPPAPAWFSILLLAIRMAADGKRSLRMDK